MDMFLTTDLANGPRLDLIGRPPTHAQLVVVRMRRYRDRGTELRDGHSSYSSIHIPVERILAAIAA